MPEFHGSADLRPPSPLLRARAMSVGLKLRA
jgi:hypothetical protein